MCFIDLWRKCVGWWGQRIAQFSPCFLVRNIMILDSYCVRWHRASRAEFSAGDR
jgi:hypothetical protein